MLPGGLAGPRACQERPRAAGGSLRAGGAPVHAEGGGWTLDRRTPLVLFAQLRAQASAYYSKVLKILNSLTPSFRKFSYEEMHNLLALPSLKGRKQKEIPSDRYSKT